MCIESYTQCEHYRMCIDSYCAPYEHECTRHKTESRFFRDIDNDSCELNHMPAGGYQLPTCPPESILSLLRNKKLCYFHDPRSFLLVGPWSCSACRRWENRPDAAPPPLPPATPQPPLPEPSSPPPAQPPLPVPALSHVSPAWLELRPPQPPLPSPPPSTPDDDDPRDATAGPSTSAALVYRTPRLRVAQPKSRNSRGQVAKVSKPRAPRSRVSTAQASSALNQVLTAEAPTVAQTTSPVPEPTHAPPEAPTQTAGTGSNVSPASYTETEE